MPAFSDLDELQLEAVRSSLLSRQYYLLTGSGTSLDSVGLDGPMKSATDLRLRLCDLNGIPSTRSLQQAYSLLEDDDVEQNITSPYTCVTPGPTVSKLVHYPWKRIFTLNVDDCLQVALRALVTPIEELHGKIESKHFLDDFSDLSPLSIQSIVNLHGLVSTSSRGYVFSHTEYAKNITRPNSWMLNLVQLIRSEPFIVTGTTLEEPDVTYYLEQRSESSARYDMAPSILIEPFPDKLTHKLCETHQLYLFEGTTLEFFEKVEAGDAPPVYWDIELPKYLDSLPISGWEKVAFEATFELIPKAVEPDTRAAPFLLGAPLTWQKIEGRVDVPREVFPGLQSAINSTILSKAIRVILVLDEPGSGKTSLLRRIALNLAKQQKNVFYFSGREVIDETACARALDCIVGPCFIFVDNFADHAAYLNKVLNSSAKKDLLFVGAERKYRRPYIEATIVDEDVSYVESQLDLEFGEAKRLIRTYEKEGLSSQGILDADEIKLYAKEIAGQSISIAGCRVQNNFRQFDQIVKDLLRDSSPEEIAVYLTAGIARFCYSGGVHRSVLYDAQPHGVLNKMLDTYARIPLAYVDRARQYIVPGRSVTAERAITVLHNESPVELGGIFSSLANALAPRVNRGEIRRRAPAAKLAGGLIDFDRVVKKFINGQAETFYDAIHDRWSWNSRYWEQRALLKLDRYLSDKTDRRLLEEGIQNARFAYSIEHHPFSLTTLAKLLFIATCEGEKLQEDLFDEAWSLISQSIEIEISWVGVKSTAFIVCFNGALAFVRNGGVLDGDQVDRLRDIVSITYRKQFRYPQLVKLRDEIAAEIL